MYPSPTPAKKTRKRCGVGTILFPARFRVWKSTHAYPYPHRGTRPVTTLLPSLCIAPCIPLLPFADEHRYIRQTAYRSTPFAKYLDGSKLPLIPHLSNPPRNTPLIRMGRDDELQEAGPARLFSLAGGLSGFIPDYEGATQRAGGYMAGSYGSVEACFRGVCSVPPVWILPNEPV
jgi:hypothetical protein